MAAVGGDDGGFRALNEETLEEYIRTNPSLFSKLGCNHDDDGDGDHDDLKIEMVNEGLMNFVYIVTSSSGYSMVIKQAPPYVRNIGESWPMSRERQNFEVKALEIYKTWCPSFVPEIYHFDPNMSLVGMRYLEPPHILLKKGLHARTQYPLLSHHISDIFANIFFRTSVLNSTPCHHKSSVDEFGGNVEMTNLMELLAFKMAFEESQYTNWTSPELDLDVEQVHNDPTIKFEVAQLKSMYREKAQALIHSDLHDGSIMVTHNSTKVIDMEFSFYGPMGYDIGTFFRNLIVPFFVLHWLSIPQNDIQSYKMWLLSTIEDTWNMFEQKFIQLWNENKVDPGSEAQLLEIYNNPENLELLQSKFMQDVFQDSLGFCAIYLIGSVIHVGPVEDFLSINNIGKRADCERRTLNFGKMLLKNRPNICSISQLISTLEQYTLNAGL